MRLEKDSVGTYHIYPKYLDKQAWTNSVDPDQRLQNAASDQGLHCLPFIKEYFRYSTSSKADFFKFWDK